jgi:hypothetical protein
MQFSNDPGHRPEGQAAMRRFPRKRIGIAGGALATALTTTAVVGVIGASAAPAPPHNHTIFPERDFVSLEGYTPGRTVGVSVRRGDLITGMADNVPIGADGIAEVNHPGGDCWDLVPDLRPGDVVAVDDGTAVESTRIFDASVTGTSRSGLTVTVSGRVVGVPAGQLEQRIVDRRLENLIGRRDARATEPTLTPARVVSGKLVTYSSMLQRPAGGTTFTATYVVRAIGTSSTAATAASNVAAILTNPELGPRALSWEIDAGGERQGLTISEMGEIGGAMDGCPGASTAPAALPTGIQEVRVNWKPGELRVRGATPTVGQTVSLRRDSATGPVLGTDVTEAPEPPHTGGSFDIRVTGASVQAKPGELWLTAGTLREGPIVVG